MSNLCGVLHLPALSVKSPRLLAELQREDLSVKELSELLKLDPGLGARLLHVANSPFFGVSGKVSSVSEAVIVLGLNQTKGVIQIEVIRSVLADYPWNLISLDIFWHRSLAIAAACQVLADRISYPRSTAFTVGLFHNLGVLGMLQQYEKEYSLVFASARSGLHLAQRELDQFRISHAQMGAEILRSWNFPVCVCQAIDEQYRNTILPTDDPASTVLGLAHTMHSARTFDDLVKCVPTQVLDGFHLDKSSVPEVLHSMDQKIGQWIRLAGG